MLRVEIRVKGRIDQDWAQWFGDLSLAVVEGETTLAGELIDQAALYGLLARLRDLGLSLVSVLSSEHSGP